MRIALGASETVALLGVSLYVLGFGTGFASSYSCTAPLLLTCGLCLVEDLLFGLV